VHAVAGLPSRRIGRIVGGVVRWRRMDGGDDGIRTVGARRSCATSDPPTSDSRSSVHVASRFSFQNDAPALHSPHVLNARAARRARGVTRLGALKFCPKIFQDSPSHRIFRRMHKALNINKK